MISLILKCVQGDESPPGSAPPVFTPPDVPSFLLAPQTIVTQPTPMTETNPILGKSFKNEG